MSDARTAAMRELASMRAQHVQLEQLVTESTQSKDDPNLQAMAKLLRKQNGKLGRRKIDLHFHLVGSIN